MAAVRHHLLLIVVPLSAAALCGAIDYSPIEEFNLLRSGRRDLLQSIQNVNAAVCGDVEHYCGGDDVILDEAYSATQSSNCTLDKDLQLYICGDYVILADEYTSLQKTRAGCRNSCSLSNVGLAIATQYFWSVTAWGSCLAACGASTQERTASCMNSIDGGQAGADLCDAAAKPSIRQPCNLIPCQVQQRGLSLAFTAWEDCSSDCGPGLALRVSSCRDRYTNLAALEGCPTYSGAKLFQDCSNPSCNSAHWKKGLWTTCSAGCGGGTRVRNVTCEGDDGVPLDDSACGQLQKPTDSSSCGTQPCVGYTWSVGSWGNCSSSCGGGVQNRTVSCVDQRGKPANASLCQGKVPPDQLQCNVLPCNFCSQTNCAGQGVCKNGVCVCQPGYRGAYCEIPPECPAILDAAGNCCNHGIVDVNGTCCAKTAVLDGSARCCDSGRRDVCGICDGTAKVVDVQNLCCQSGILDSGGYCCASGRLDECGVCDGDSQTCLLSSDVVIQVPEPKSLTSLGLQGSALVVSSFLSSILAVNSTEIEITDFTLVPGAVYTAANDPANLQVHFSVSPAASGGAQTDLRASVVTSRLQAAVGKASKNRLFILSAVNDVRRVGLCGNQVCEAGERFSIQGPVGCLGDCPFLLQACPPALPNATQCSGNGRCLSATGTCVCFLGYAGNDCSLCAEGYTRYGNSCARYVRADLPLLNASSSANVLAVLAVGIAMAVLGALLLVIAVVVIVRQRRQLKSLRRYRRRSSLKTPLTADKGSTEVANSKMCEAATHKDVETPDCSSGDEVEPSPKSLFSPVARAKSVFDVARMHKESLQGLRTKSNTGPSSPTSAAAASPSTRPAKPLFSRRNSGRPRSVPLLRELTSKASADASAQSPGKAAEKSAIRKKFRMLESSKSMQRKPSILQAAESQRFDAPAADAGNSMTS